MYLNHFWTIIFAFCWENSIYFPIISKKIEKINLKSSKMIERRVKIYLPNILCPFFVCEKAIKPTVALNPITNPTLFS